VTWIVLVTLMVAPTVRATDEAADNTPLQVRARSLLRSYPEAKTREAQIVVREQLLAMADTLESAGEDVLASHCLERAGMVGYRLAEYDDASLAWERGLAVARRSGDKKRVAALLNARAVGVSISGDNDGAVVLQRELIDLRRELGDVRGEGISWHNLAFSYFALFRYPEAIDALARALRLHREAGNQFAIAGSMGTMANALFEVGRAGDALAMADSAVARARDIGDPSVLGAALQGRARQLHYAGRVDDALADFDEAHRILADAGDVRVSSLNDVNWANALVSGGDCARAAAVIDAARDALAPIGDPSQTVWADCVRARVSARCGDPGKAQGELVATIERLEAIRDSIPEEVRRADAFRAAGGAYTDLALLEIARGNPAQAWAAVESGAARVFRDALDVGNEVVPAETLGRLQAQLAEVDAVALQYGVATADRMVACVVTPSDVHALAVEIYPGFRQDVAAALQLMASGAADSDCAEVLTRISGAMLGPVAAVLAGAPGRMVIMPGSLAGFPVEVLPLPGTDDAAIGDRFSVSYAVSATAFLRLQERTPNGGAVLVFADPALDEGNGEGMAVAMRSAQGVLTPLPEARREGEAVGGSGVILVGRDATRAAFLDRARGAAVLHIAAHAVVDGTSPEYSGIVLADAGGGLVTVDDLESLALDADLVSLSGCRTAGGYVSTGDGVFGLTRAFLLAGARSVVSSWWDVEDAAARHFMELYYAGLRDGQARDSALQQARNTMAAEGYPLRDRCAFALAGATAQPVAALAASSSGRSGAVTVPVAVLIVILIVATRRRRRRA
jgi:CHAT domain-containing protein